jgi:hypothetical protein
MFDPETQQLANVSQRVTGPETDSRFQGRAFRVETRGTGSSTFTWIRPEGLPVLEISEDMPLVGTLSDENAARRFLDDATVSRKETLLDYSRLRVATPPPRDAPRLRIRLDGVPAGVPIPTDARQRCVRKASTVTCDILHLEPDQALSKTPPTAHDLEASPAVNSTNADIVRLARDITKYAPTPDHQAEVFVNWIRRNVAAEAVDAFSALDVLKTRRAECQGHTYLYAALARAVGIPTRVVNGIVYSDADNGFLFHTWAESRLEDGWVGIDPTFGQIGVDATHLKLVEGENIADLAPLAALMGHLRLDLSIPPEEKSASGGP